MAVSVQSNQVFGSDPMQQADIFLPDQPNGAGLLFVHGGAWVRGDKTDGVDLCTALAEVGFTMAAPNYRLAPAHLFPAAHDDVDACFTWFKESEFGKNLKTFGVFGISVGGSMAQIVAAKHGVAVTSWSAIVGIADWMASHQDVTPSLNAAEELGLSDPHALNAAFYRGFVETYLGETTAERLDELETINQMSNNVGPVLMFNSVDEISPIDSATEYFKQLVHLQPDAQLNILSGSAHAGGYADRAMSATIAFFNRTLLDQ